MNSASLRTALIAAVIVAIGAFAIFSIGGATAQQACIQPLAGNGTYNGTWDNTCLSENTPLGDYTFPTGTRYARFYTFTLSETSTVTVELQSSADTYLYLMQGKGKTGTILHYNDDIAPSENTNSRISQSLSTGKYTIEATTYEIETTGNFTLTISGSPAALTPTITPTPGDVLNRLTALETRATTQQGLIATMESKITALDSRIAVLESDASSPTPTPTPTVTPTPTSVPTYVPTPVRPRETIIFGDLNWRSALLQNRIAQYIVEHGYGYSTDVKFGPTLPLIQGLKRGDTHVLMEIWLPNQDEAWQEALAAGVVSSPGLSLGNDWQSAFVIPKYLQEQYPELDSVDDLKNQKFKDIFKTAETGGKARLVSCVIGWACEEVNAAQINGYGLTEHVAVVNPGDGASLHADLYGAYERREPWLGYQWGTSEPSLLLDLVRLKEPAYSDQCWFTTKACAYKDATILIGVNSELPARAPDIINMLRRWDFNINVYRTAVRWQNSNPNADTNATALWWLNANYGIWSQWVTDEAAAAIQQALNAGETPGGWPTR